MAPTPSCDADSLPEQVAEVLGGPLEVAYEAVVEPADGGFRLQLMVAGKSRTFSAPRCQTVLDAAALVLATVQRDREAAASTTPRVFETLDLELPQSLEPGTPRFATLLSPRLPAREKTSPIAVVLGLDGGVDGGSLPSVGGYMRATVGAAGRTWRVKLLGSVRLPTRTSIEPPQGARVRMGTWSAGVLGCGVVPLAERWSIPLCAGVEAGQAFARGEDFAGASSTTLPWLATVLTPSVEWRAVPRLSVSLGAEVGVAPLGGSLIVDGIGPVYEVRRVFGRASVGIRGFLGRGL